MSKTKRNLKRGVSLRPKVKKIQDFTYGNLNVGLKNCSSFSQAERSRIVFGLLRY